MDASIYTVDQTLVLFNDLEPTVVGPDYINTSVMIYHHGVEPERAAH